MPPALHRATLTSAVDEKPPSIPPSCSDCTSKMQPVGGGTPTQSQSRMWRASDGKLRFDTPHTSIISVPAEQKTIVLDHLKKEATVFPTPPPPPGEPLPGMPKPSPGAPPPVKPIKVEDLGKSMIEGHEVEGKRYTLPPPPSPPKPEMPKVSAPKPPEMPKVPGAPKPPDPPKFKPPKLTAPKLPSVPSVTEIWTSTKLKTPVLTKTSTAAGEQTTYCKPTSTDEPHPSVFQIPKDYKLKPPTFPSMKPPAKPSLKPPAVPSIKPPAPPSIKPPAIPSIKPPKI